MLPAFTVGANAQTASVLPACFGERRDITIARQMPYIPVKMGAAEGEFVLDFGSNISSIDPAGFKNGVKPVPTNGAAMIYEQPYFFDQFDFFGRTGGVKLLARKTTVTDLGLQQAGILGTDFFMEFIFTLDYANKFLYKSTRQAFCQDADLLKAGFKPVSTAGYYADQFSRLLDPATTINVPTVPVRIGRVAAVAQIDPGYDDSVYPHTVNVNRAFFAALQAAGVALVPVPNVMLSTCSGEHEKGTAYRLGPGYSFEITGTDGQPVLIERGAFIIVKEGTAAHGCAGIGTWAIPAAQIGASFLVDAQQVVFDPFSSRVWFHTGPGAKLSRGTYAPGQRRLKEVPQGPSRGKPGNKTHPKKALSIPK
ncbi:hypothetical protein [Hymenobacter sp. CRA2]|uniref:hypothetical protein n=1 Tax=Hymenobacter sp. CRA2 TaxID=1955620 RepID=UPI0011176A4B|nr:hypothetical protein [Hymenobacter sp. CRA2]